MSSVLSLQMLPAAGFAGCQDSGVSCDSHASCRSDSSCVSQLSGHATEFLNA